MMNEITNSQLSSSQQPSSSQQQKQQEDLAKVERERVNHLNNFNSWLMNDYSKELIAENLKRKQKKNKEVTESESERHSTTKIIDKEKAGKIICYLKKIIDTESAQYDANFRSWVQNSEIWKINTITNAIEKQLNLK
jgi:hypothetical protein